MLGFEFHFKPKKPKKQHSNRRVIAPTDEPTLVLHRDVRRGMAPPPSSPSPLRQKASALMFVFGMMTPNLELRAVEHGWKQGRAVE